MGIEARITCLMKHPWRVQSDGETVCQSCGLVWFGPLPKPPMSTR